MEIWKLCQLVRWAQELKNKHKDCFGSQYTSQQLQIHHSTPPGLQNKHLRNTPKLPCTWASLLCCGSYNGSEGCSNPCDMSMQFHGCGQLQHQQHELERAMEQHEGSSHTAFALSVRPNHSPGEPSVNLKMSLHRGVG